jgi:tetratricopeptide (TPR) repeat protein
MKMRTIFLLLSLGFVSAGFIFAGPAEDKYAEGTEMMKQGDFDTAMKSFAAAAKLDREQVKYREMYSLVRRIVKTRNVMETEANLAKWKQYAEGLRNFYYTYRLWDQAYELDKQLFAKESTDENRLLLVESMVAAGKNKEALAELDKLAQEKVDTEAKLYRAMALGSSGEKEAAAAIMKDIKIADDAPNGMRYYASRASMVIGDKEHAYEYLRKTLEAIPPSAIENFRVSVKTAPEFAQVAGSDEFAAVLSTESKISESSCSGGSDCGSCRLSTSCGSK